MKNKRFVRMLAVTLAVVSVFLVAMMPAGASISQKTYGYYCLEADMSTSVTGVTGYAEANFVTNHPDRNTAIIKVGTLGRSGDGYRKSVMVHWIRKNEDSYTNKFNPHVDGRVVTTSSTLVEYTYNIAAGDLVNLFHPTGTVIASNKVENVNNANDYWQVAHLAHWSRSDGAFFDCVQTAYPG